MEQMERRGADPRKDGARSPPGSSQPVLKTHRSLQKTCAQSKGKSREVLGLLAQVKLMLTDGPVKAEGPRIFFDSFIHSTHLKKIIYLFIYGCIGSSLLRAGFLQLRRAGAALRCGARASHGGGFLLQSRGSRRVGFRSCGSRAQQLWRTGLVAPRHVGSSRTRARTCVPCISGRILNHCATRQVPIQHICIDCFHPKALFF